MILLDTNVLIDIFEDADTAEAEWSRVTYGRVADDRAPITNPVVLAELAGQVGSPERLPETLRSAGIEIVAFGDAPALQAGAAYRLYRQRGGSRTTILPDFLIAAHAAALGAALMTRDRRLASYFPELFLITPETHPHG